MNSKKLNIISYKSNFMKLDKNINIEKIINLIGKDVYIDIYNEDHTSFSSCYASIINVNVEKKEVELKNKLFENNIIYNLSDIRAIEELKNYNKKKFDFKNLINKSVMLTDMHDVCENVIVKSYDDKNIYVQIYFENKNGQIYDNPEYEIPIFFIKDIMIVE